MKPRSKPSTVQNKIRANVGVVNVNKKINLGNKKVSTLNKERKAYKKT